MLMTAQATGQYGGVVRRRFPGDNKVWMPGEEISPELAQKWQPSIRIALGRSHYVYWYETPESVAKWPQTVQVTQLDGTVAMAAVTVEEGEVSLRVLAEVPAATAQRRRGVN